MRPSEEERLAIDRMNCEAVMQTLTHHGNAMAELERFVKDLQTQVNDLRQELAQQRGLIVRSLQNKYGNGPTS